MITIILSICGIGLLTILYFLIHPKVKKIETDYRQIKNQIEESLNQDELDDCDYSIDNFFQLHQDNKACFKYIRKLENCKTERESDLLILQIQPLLNINEPSK